MRGFGLTLLILVICVLAAVGYTFLGRSQLRSALDDVNKQNESLRREAEQIQFKAAKLPLLRKQLPQWRQQLKLFKAAIPPKIQDDVFFDFLGRQLKLNGVELLRVDMAKGASWLGKSSEEQLKALADKGIDVATAKQINVAFYSINLLGDFDKILGAFEGLKRYRRIYCIDQVTGPSGGGAGTVTQNITPQTTPLEITGKIFFGIPAAYLSIEELDKAYAEAVAVPVARSVKRSVTNAAASLLAGDPSRNAAPASATPGGSSSKGGR